MNGTKQETSKWYTRATVLSQEQIAAGIYSLWLKAEEIAGAVRPGQFLSVYSAQEDRLLPRPISICEVDRAQGSLRLVYRIAGKGTREFAGCGPGTELTVLGPLGNGFPLEKLPEGGRALLIGGGIGIPPLVQLAKELPGEKRAKRVVAGYRDELFLTEELEGQAELYIATEDGSAGTKGTVLDAMEANGLGADVIYACGPTPMLRALKAWAEEKHIPCWISMEERMACGIGACLACVCKTRETDAHSRVKNARICADGPVFLATEVLL